MSVEHAEHPCHISYLLRLWQVKKDGKVIWRASLQSADTGERRGFATLVDLLSFLEEEYAPNEHQGMRSHADTE